MAEEMVAGVRRGGGDTGDSKLAIISDVSFLDHFILNGCDVTQLNAGHGRGLVRGLLEVMGGKEEATGETSSPPIKLVSYVPDCQNSFTTSLSWKKLVFYENIKHPAHASHTKI